MASEKAKALAAQQKAERKAERLRKKKSTDPRDWGQVKQFVETYKLTREIDKKLDLYLVLVGVGAAAAFALVGVLTKSFWVLNVIGAILMGLLAAMLLLTKRATAAMYKRYEGKPGSAEVALQMLDKKKWTYNSAIAFNRQMDVIHRALGPAGIVLVGEGGSNSRVTQMLASEQRKHEQVAYGVPVTSIVLGNGKGEVPLPQLAKHIKKLPKVVDPAQVIEVKQRLKALDSVRDRVGVPKGPLPTSRGSARALRGR